jgi:hypothetical protein
MEVHPALFTTVRLGGIELKRRVVMVPLTRYTRGRWARPLARHDRDTFYTFDARGYTDYPAYSATAN